MPYLYDTHLHSSEASVCGSSTAAEQIRASKDRGYTGVILTDHLVKGYTNCDDSLPWKEQVRFFVSAYEKAKKEGDACGVDVFFGWEFAARDDQNGLDFLTYGLDEEFLLRNSNLLDLTIKEYCDLVHKHGGYIAQAHPFRDIAKGPEWGAVNPHLLDGVEVFNAGKAHGNINRLAYEFAAFHNLPMQAGSDSHHVKYPHSPCGIILDKKADSIFDIIEALKYRRNQLLPAHIY